MTSLIDQHGAEQITIRQITRSLGIASSAFYKHFSSKEELLDGVLVYTSQKVCDGFREKYQGVLLSKPSVEQLYLFGIYLHEQFLLHENTMHFLFFSASALKAYSEFNIKGQAASNFALLNEALRIIEEVKNDNGLSSDVQTLCTKWWAFLQGYTLLVMTNVIEPNNIIIANAIDDVICGDMFRDSKKAEDASPQ